MPGTCCERVPGLKVTARPPGPACPPLGALEVEPQIGTSNPPPVGRGFQTSTWDVPGPRGQPDLQHRQGQALRTAGS